MNRREFCSIKNYLKSRLKGKASFSTGVLISFIITGRILLGSSLLILNDINTTGDYSPGVSEDGLNIRNEAAIETSGSYSSGIEGINSTVSNYGSIVTEGYSSRGLDLFAGWAKNYGRIETAGGYGHAIYLNEAASGENHGDIVTSGDYSAGITGSSDLILNTGSITTSGSNSPAIEAWRPALSGTNPVITNEGDITTRGSDSAGIKIWEDGIVDNNGGITTIGDRSYGIEGVEGTVITNTSSGRIHTKGSLSHGIFSKGSTVDNLGSISATGREAHGIYATDGSVVDHRGVISVEGEGAHGIVLEDSTLYSTGEISSSTGYAVLARSGDNKVILGEGSKTTGIIMGGNGDNLLRLSGSNTDKLTVVNFDKIIKTDGGEWDIRDSSIDIKSSESGLHFGSIDEARAYDSGTGGDLTIGSGSEITIMVDSESRSGQVVADSLTLAGGVDLKVDSSLNDGSQELYFNEMIVTDTGFYLEGDGGVEVSSGGWEVSYLTNDNRSVDVRLTRIAYNDRTDGSLGDVADNLEKNYEGAQGDMRNIMNILNDLDNAEYNRALKEMSGALYTSTVFLSTEVSKQFENGLRSFINLSDREDELERNSRGAQKDYSQYVNLIGGTSTYDGSSSTVGFDTDSFGFMGATEIRDQFGFSYGYLRTSVDYDDRGGSSNTMDSFHGGVFHKYRREELKVDSHLAFEYSQNDVDREIRFDGVSRTGSADFDTYNVSIGTQLGYDFYVNNFVITPKAGLTYTRIEQDSISESGAGALNINQDSEGYNSVRSLIGSEVSYDIPAAYGRYILSGEVHWVHEFGDIYDSQRLTLEGNDGEFRVSGLDISEDTYRFIAGGELRMNTSTSYYLTYTYEGESSYDNHMGSLGVKFFF